MTVIEAIKDPQVPVRLNGGLWVYYSPEEDLFYNIDDGYPVLLGVQDMLSDKWERETTPKNVVVVPKFLRAKLRENIRKLHEEYEDQQGG